MKKKLLLLASIMALSLSVTAVGCSGKSDESSTSNSATESTDTGSDSSQDEIELAVPAITLNGDNSVTWTAVEGATGYVVNLNGVDLEATTALSYAAETAVGAYTIKVKAIAVDAESEYSESVSYHIYAVTLTAGDGYVLTGASSVVGGENYTFTVTAEDPDYDYTNMVVKVNGTAITAVDGVYTVENVSEALAITVEGIVKINSYAVTLTAGDGYVLTGASSVVGGENYTFTLTAEDPDYDYTNMVVKVNGTVITAVEGVYTVENVAEALVITVEGIVAYTYYDVTFSQDVAYTLVGEQTAIGGKNYTFTIETGVIGYDYTNMAVKVNGTAITAVEGVYTVENVTEALAITVEGIAVAQYTVTVPETQEGYTITCETMTVEHGEDFYFSVVLAKYYGQSPLVVKVNGEEVVAYEEGQYAIAEVSEDITIVVEGIVRDGEYQYVKDIIGEPINAGDGVVFDDETGVASATASSNGMSIFLEGKTILYYGEGYDYVKLKLSSSTMAEFTLVTTAESGEEDWTSVYVTLSKATDYYIPLNDVTKHDFNNYSIVLYIAGEAQNVTIEEISFMTQDDMEKVEAELAKIAPVLNPENWEKTSDGTCNGATAASNTISVSGWGFQLKASAIQELMEAGYNQMTISVAPSGKATHVYIHGNFYVAGDTVTFDLNTYVSSGIKFYPKSAANNDAAVDGALTISNIELAFVQAEHPDPEALAVVVNADNWSATDGGSVHVNETAADKIVVGGWYFKLTAEAVQELIALGYSEVSFATTSRGYNGSATHAYFTVTGEWYELGETVTLNLEAHKEKGIKIKLATGGASESKHSDGAVQIENIVFTKATVEPEVNPDAEAVAIVVNADNWVETDGGSVHVNETGADMIVVGGWYFKLTAEAVQELIALGYSEVSFATTSRGYNGSATHAYFAITEEWYELGATVTLNLEAHKEKGIKIRLATGAASSSNYSDGAIQIENIAFTK